MFGSLFVINYFTNYWLDYIFNRFYSRKKLFNCLISLQSLHEKNIVNSYQKELLGWFSEDFKMWPSPNVLKWHTSNWLLFNIYVESLGLCTMLILRYFAYTTVVKISENKTIKIMAIGIIITWDCGVIEIWDIGIIDRVSWVLSQQCGIDRVSWVLSQQCGAVDGKFGNTHCSLAQLWCTSVTYYTWIRLLVISPSAHYLFTFIYY